MSSAPLSPGASLTGAARGRSLARAPARADVLVLCAVLAWTALVLALSWNRWGDLTMDTGYDLLAGARVAGGELPYIDFVYSYGPAGPLLLGGLYAVLGVSLWPAVVLGLVVVAAAVVLTYAVARALVTPVPAGVAAALTATMATSNANTSFVLPHAISAALGIVLVLSVVLLLVPVARGHAGQRGRLLAAGAVGGLLAITRPELAVAFLAACVAWLAIAAWRADDRRAGVRGLILFALPALALPLVVYGAFATQTGVSSLLWENLYPRDFLDAAGRTLLEAQAPWTLSSIVKLVARTAVYAAGLGLLVLAGRAIDHGGARRRLALAGAGAAGAAFLLVLALRPETVRFYLEWAYAWIPLGAWIAVLVLLVRRRTGAAFLVCLALACVSTLTYADMVPFPNADFPSRTAAYLLPLAAVFLAWLHARAIAPRGGAVATLGTAWLILLALASGVLAVKDDRAETFTVRAAHGSLAAKPSVGPQLQGAVDAIQARTRAGEPVLIGPQLTALYVMTGRENPLRQLSLLPGVLPTPADQDGAIARLSRVRLAVIDRRPFTEYGHGAFGTTFDQRIAAWLRRDFVRVDVLRGAGPESRTIDVWTRRTP